MTKKRISSVDLSWLTLEELSNPRSRGTRRSLAVVPDDKHGWRVVLPTAVKGFLRPMTNDDLLTLGL